MTDRGQNLLDQPLSSVVRCDVKKKTALKRIGIITVRDLLYYFPVRYTHIGTTKLISEVEHNEHVTIYGHITNLSIKKSFKSRVPMSEAKLTDVAGTSIKVLWFHQPYIAKMIENDSLVKLSGTVSIKNGRKSLMNPEIEKVADLPIDAHDSLFQNEQDNAAEVGMPLYRETRGVTSKWMYHTIAKILSHADFERLEDPLPQYIRNTYSLPDIKTALVWIHMPRKQSDAEAAKKRFAFEEIFFVQLQAQQYRATYEHMYSHQIRINHNKLDEFIGRFPFTLTDSQSDAIQNIVNDIESDKPMSRLIEGDVGSGKTAVAASVAYAVASQSPEKKSFGNFQVAYMAPTEVLATQLFENFIQYFGHTGMSVALMTGSGCRKYPSKVNPSGWTDISKNQLKKWIANGEIPMVIGTHALISKNLAFKNLGLVIVDEQHRFGTKQRMELARKAGHAPHYLSMTATPIPRTLALTIYGDLDLTIIDQMPSGRKPVITNVIDPIKRKNVYADIRAELENGRQLYVICPRIYSPNATQPLTEESWRELSPAKRKALRLKSVEDEVERLQKDIFPEYHIGSLHSKLKKDEKEKVMEQFSNHELDILVATSVIEVGVNVPNATMIIIEGAERYGLAQLHQLRGRVIRGTHQAYCYLFTTGDMAESTSERLSAFLKAKNGFELAEYDLALRGAGSLIGNKQWGISDLAMEALKNPKLVEFARTEAKKIITEDPTLESWPDLETYLKQGVHFE
ncbi:ATP-dependent DNA helicase RecG [Candidatus Nomurabacteria bacterium]|nr:ATP-dependent DNA helicase RecG [Candidatus Nomurabacteria bacterium]